MFTSHRVSHANHLLYGRQVTFYYPALKRFLIVVDKNLSERIELQETDDITTDEEEVLAEAKFIKEASDPNREMMVTLTSVLSKEDPKDVHSKCIWLLENAFRSDDPDGPADGSKGGAVHFGDTTNSGMYEDIDVPDLSGLGDTITFEVAADISEGERQSPEQKEQTEEKEEQKARRHWVRIKHFNSGKYLGLDTTSKDKRLIPVDKREDALWISLEPTTSQLKFQQIQLSDYIYMVGVENRLPMSSCRSKRSWLCGGVKSLGDLLKANHKPELSLEQCEARCGVFWTEAVFRNIDDLMKHCNSNKVNQDWFEWFARQYCFEELLVATSFDALADAYPLNASNNQVDQAAFQVSAVHEQIASEIHECNETIRHLGRLTKHLYEYTNLTAAQAMKDIRVDSSESKEEQNKEELMQQGVLMQQVVEAAAGLVFYVIRASEEQVAAHLKARDFEHRLKNLLAVDFDKSGGLPRRQRFVREQGGFELLFKLATWAAVGQAAFIALKMDKINKTQQAIQMLLYQISIAEQFGIKSKSLSMNDARQVYKYLTNKKLQKPQITRPYALMGHVFYSFIRQLFKNNRSVERMVSCYLHIILAHFPLNIGAPATFASLTNDNRKLLETRVEHKHIRRFLSMIQLRGMNPDFMRYLYSLCGYLDRALSSKQVSVCRLALLYNQKAPHSILMQTLVSDGTCDPMQDPVNGVLKQGLEHIDSRTFSKTRKPWLSWSKVQPFFDNPDNTTTDPSKVKGVFVAAEDNDDHGGGSGALQLYLSWNSGKKGYKMEKIFKAVVEHHEKLYGTKMVPLEVICEIEEKRQAGVGGWVGR